MTDGAVRLAREIPDGSSTWKKLYHRRNCAESRNSVQRQLGLKRLPVHGLPPGYSQVLLGDFVANQQTLVRLFRQATALLSTSFAQGGSPEGQLNHARTNPQSGYRADCGADPCLLTAPYPFFSLPSVLT